MAFMYELYKPVTGIIRKMEYQKGTMKVMALTGLHNRMYSWLEHFSTSLFVPSNHCYLEQDGKKII